MSVKYIFRVEITVHRKSNCLNVYILSPRLLCPSFSVHASGASGYSRPYVGAGPHSPLHMASRYAQLAKNGGNASPVFGPLR